MASVYPDFVQSTGYGDVAGLSGANCRHSFGAFLPGISQLPISAEEFAEMERKEKETKHYKWTDSRGVKHENDFTLREALDRQREMERQMRYTRAAAKGMKAAGQDEEYTALKARYRHQRAEYKRFSESMGIITQFERVYVDGLGRI